MEHRQVAGRGDGGADQDAFFTFEVEPHGWASLSLVRGRERAAVHAWRVSYLSDALGDLLRAVLRIIDTRQNAEMAWLLEPAEIRCLLSQEPDGAIGVLVDRRDGPDHPWHRLNRYATSADTLLHETLQTCSDVDPQVYERSWGGQWPFPEGALSRLRSLAEDRPPDSSARRTDE